MNREKTIYNRIIKRILDIVCSFMAIVFLSIVYLPICVVIKCTSKGPIFFKQKRVGKDKTYFNILKFRTMRIDTPKDCPTHLLKNPDQYITKVGKFLRKTSLDELPQLINIIKGDLSIIGPRPVVKDELEKYEENIAKFLSVTPGLTGNWAANGRNNTTYEERMKLELEYVDNISLKTDIKIFFQTIYAVIKKEGAM